MNKEYKVKPLAIEGGRLIFRNFAGKEGKFNPAGVRSFCVLLETELANELAGEGWNIKWLQPRDPEEDKQAYLHVRVRFESRPPKIKVITTSGHSELTEETIASLDWADIENVDLTITPYEWEVSGKTGIKAYLKNMYVTLTEDKFASKYRDIPNSYNDTNEEQLPPWD